MSKHLGILSALGLAITLVACGGNSGGGDSAVAAKQTATDAFVEGAWSGTNSLDNSFDMLLLENGELYQVYGTTDATTGALTVLGLSQGHYSVSGNTLTMPFTQYNYVPATLKGSLSATVVSGISITGSASGGVGTLPLTFSAEPTSVRHSSYKYNAAAELGDIAGPWTLAYLLAQPTPFAFSIGTDGVLAGTNLGCSFTGSVTPRGTKKNVFDVSLRFGQAPCVSPDTTVTGVALSYMLGNGKRQFIAALQDASKASGTVLYAQR